MLVEAEIWTIAHTDQGNAVLVKPIGSEVAVPIFIGKLEAQSILIGMGNVPMPRPLTHDLILSVMDKMSITLERVEIIMLKEGTYYAQLILRSNGKEIIIDARPSDSLALAVRRKCAIYIADSVVDEAGVAVSSIAEEPQQNPISEKEKTKQKLETDLKKAVEEEDYEEAARIRDMLAESEGSE